MPERPRASKVRVSCTVNGKPTAFEANPMARFLDVLREELRLTGTKEGCGEGECGACAIEMNGELVNSCLVPALQVEGASIRTIEGVAHGSTLQRGPAVVSRSRRRAMRHLHARHDSCRGKSSGTLSPPQRSASSRRARRKSLPLHRLHQNFRIGIGSLPRSRSAAVRSYVPAFEMEAPRDLASALARLAAEPGAWKPFAGGTDLMVLLEAGKLPPGKYLSIWQLPELRGIEAAADHVTLGALATYTQVRRDPLLAAEFPLLCRAASETGSIATQNRGTLGGNIANGVTRRRFTSRAACLRRRT